MIISNQPAQRCVMSCLIIAALAACGGGDGSSSPGSGGTPSPPVVAPPTNPTPSTIPTDFYLPYFAPGDGVYLVPSADPTSKRRVVSGGIGPAATVEDGEWNAGVLSNSRPHTLVYFQNGQWWKLPLRTGDAQTPVAIADDPAGQCSGTLTTMPDYQTPSHSYLLVTTSSDADCTNVANWVTRAIRLDDTPTTPIRSKTGTPVILRSFFGANGQITGFVGGVYDLTYYDANFDAATVLVGNLSVPPRRAATFARTADHAYFSVRTSTQAALYRVDASGALTGPLYAVANGALNGGYADTTAMYVIAVVSGTDRLIRVPFDGSAATDLGTAPAAPLVVGLTDNAVIVDAYDANNVDTLYALPKSGGTSVSLASGSYAIDLDHLLVRGNRVYWTALDADGKGNPVAARSGISTDLGAVIEQYDRSEWWLYVGAPTIDLGRTAGVAPIAAGLLRGYTGDYTKDGHFGGTIAYYDLVAATKTDRGVLNEHQRLVATGELPFGLARYVTPGTDLYGNGDIVSFVNGATQFSVLTRTADVDESTLY